MIYKKTFISLVFIFFTSLTTGVVHADYQKLPSGAPVYRLYNKSNGEHLYTTNAEEKETLLVLGWIDEKIGWCEPFSGGNPIYRIYNPNAQGGDHYYTTSISEAQYCVNLGWKWDNNGNPTLFSGGSTNVFVAFNPNTISGSHNYTINSNEQKELISLGWKFGTKSFSAISFSNELSKLPKILSTGTATTINLDDSINSLRSMVLESGKVPLGTRAILFHDMGMTVKQYSSGLFWTGKNILVRDFNGNEEEVNPSILQSFYSSSYFPINQADGQGNETAILTSKGWYLLPDYRVMNGDGTLKVPDFSKFIQTGNISDLINYSDGTPLVYNKTDQFGKPIFIS